jgi:hypothetical protein
MSKKMMHVTECVPGTQLEFSTVKLSKYDNEQELVAWLTSHGAVVLEAGAGSIEYVL